MLSPIHLQFISNFFVDALPPFIYEETIIIIIIYYNTLITKKSLSDWDPTGHEENHSGTILTNQLAISANVSGNDNKITTDAANHIKSAFSDGRWMERYFGFSNNKYIHMYRRRWEWLQGCTDILQLAASLHLLTHRETSLLGGTWTRNNCN